MPEDLVTVGTFRTAGDAEVARNALTAAGIESYVADDHAADWLTAIAVRGIKVRVRRSDLMRATEVLESPPEPAGEVEPPEEEREPPPNTCPNCGSDDIRRLPKLWISIAAAGLAAAFGAVFDQMEGVFYLIGAIAIFGVIAEPRRCRECGESFR